MLPVLENLNDWNTDSIHDTLMALVLYIGYQKRAVVVACEERHHLVSQLPLVVEMELADILGKEESIRRIKAGIALLQA